MSTGSFTRRYLIWLVVPPAAVTVPLAFLFLQQVIQLTPAAAADIVLLLFLLWAATAWIYGRVLTPYGLRFEEAAGRGDASRELSDCLERTKSIAIVTLTIAALIFALAATLLVMPSLLGFGYFIVAAVIVAFAGITWAYAAGKRRLGGQGRGQYVGRELSIGQKIGIVFIGSFIISSVALVELISSKTTLTLE